MSSDDADRAARADAADRASKVDIAARVARVERVDLITEFPKVIVEGIERQAAEVTKFIILRTWQNLTISPEEGGTPRKTGFASASWIVSIGEPSSEVAGSKESVDYSIGAASVETLRGYSLDQGAVFLINNVPYIWRLNYGWSPQQTAGFVERAHQQALNDADEKFRDL